MEEKTKYKVKYTTQFKKDYKRMLRRHLPLDNLKKIVALLANGLPLPSENKDHELVGNWAKHRECHIQNDWLLIYQIRDDILVLELTRTGTHSDLF